MTKLRTKALTHISAIVLQVYQEGENAHTWSVALLSVVSIAKARYNQLTMA